MLPVLGSGTLVIMGPPPSGDAAEENLGLLAGPGGRCFGRRGEAAMNDASCQDGWGTT